MHNLEKWHHNRIINNDFLFVFFKEETCISFISFWFLKNIYLYIFGFSKKVGVLEISHILKVDEKITYTAHPTDTKA